ncbi:shikimate kinase [Anaerosolibacter sp.]|uniref:shikimate kinase n=1 Tax=Anaerosolibacter sp. TaxID=1872527 RepID=UPI0039F10055
MGVLKELEDIRHIIDTCDKELTAIFERRLEAVLEILAYKREKALPVLQPEREQEVLNKVHTYLKYPEFSLELESLFRQILKISRRLQSKRLFPYNIVLIGFMGSGKSTVGKEISKPLEMDYVDTDHWIIEKTGMSINEIFRTQGEAGFRKLEVEAIKSLQDKNNTIISCGGGVVLTPENVEALKKNGRLIWLKATPQEIYRRISGDTSRPLLKDTLSVEKIEEMLTKRAPLYENAKDIIVDTQEKTISEISMEIIEGLLKNMIYAHR